MLDFLLNPKVYGTVIILLSSYIIYKILYDIVDKIVIKGKDELEIKKRTTILHLFRNIARYLILIIMILLLLNLYGINTTSLITGLGIAGVVVGLGLQDVLKDVFNGISIIFDNYYIIGDIVEYEGFTGTVIEFGLKNTKIKKYTGEVLIISNRNIDKIINITQEKASTCISIPTAYEEDYDKVEKVIKDTLDSFKENNKEVSKIEYLGINELADSSIIYQVLITCNRGKQWAVKRAFLKEIKIAYEKNNIKIPYNQLEVHNGTKV